MRNVAFAIALMLGALTTTHQVNAAVSANGVYRAGCAGPDGAALPRSRTAAALSALIYSKASTMWN